MRASPRIPRDVPQPVRMPREGIRQKHLDFIKQLPCIGCGREPPCEPMHIRRSDAKLKKFNTMARKPDDKFTAPGCHNCHIACQHTKEGEPAFWARLGIDPLDLALRLWAVSGDFEAGRAAIFKARQRIGLHQRGTRAMNGSEDWRIEDIRRWHKLSRDTTSQHWRDVDLLLDALSGRESGDAEDILADIECALEDARSALRRSRQTRRGDAPPLHKPNNTPAPSKDQPT